MTLTEAQRAPLLDRAVRSMRDYLAAGQGTDRHEVSRLSERASTEVTDAVTRGEYLHTQIAQLTGCTGLRVIDMINDWDARGRALGVERNVVKNYETQVREAAQSYAAQRVGAFGRSEELFQLIAKQVGVTRAVVYSWLKPSVSDS